MDELRKILAWLFFYLMATLFSLVIALCGMDLFWPSYDVKEESSGPVERQFYRLLVDRGSWMTGDSHPSLFKQRMSEKARRHFSGILNDISFKRDCRSGQQKANGQGMHCTINGNDVYLTSDT